MLAAPHTSRLIQERSRHAKYLIHFKANPEAWPTDPAAVLALWEGASASASFV